MYTTTTRMLIKFLVLIRSLSKDGAVCLLTYGGLLAVDEREMEQSLETDASKVLSEGSGRPLCEADTCTAPT